MHCEKSSTSQIVFYSIQIWMLNTLCFHRIIGEIVIRKDFPLKLFHKKAFPWQFDKVKRKFLFANQLFVDENKIILAHCTLIFFPCNAEHEINQNYKITQEDLVGNNTIKEGHWQYLKILKDNIFTMVLWQYLL